MAPWEITDEDIKDVISKHGLPCDVQAINLAREFLNEDAIANGVLYFTDMDDQIQSALEDIETQLIEAGIIPANSGRKFSPVGSRRSY